MRFFQYFILIPCLFSTTLAQERYGEITGQVRDGNTQEPLAGVSVVVVEVPAFGAATDTGGYFRIKNIDVGEYSLKVSLIGYKPAVITNVVVSTGRSAKVSIKLEESAVTLQGVNVQADYFGRAGAISPISTIGLDGAEVKRSPGSVQDMQRIVANLPGIANSNDQNNDLIVRGGSPNENLTIMDYIEIPSTNHYPNQFNSGGPINMVNVDLIQDIQFSSGGFPAAYGDKMSSVLNVTTREGDRNRSFASNTGFNMAGFGTVMEGGINEGRGSWIVSARKSFLEALDDVVGLSSIGLTAIPRYWDTQGKVVYDLSHSQQLIFSGIYGDDKIGEAGKPTKKNLSMAGRADSSAIGSFDFASKQYALGLSLKSLWGTKGYSVLTLSGIGNQYRVNTSDDYIIRSYDNTGEVINYRVMNSRETFRMEATEVLTGVKYEFFYQPHTAHEISAGVNYLTTWKFDDFSTWVPDTMRYDFNHDGRFESGPVTFPVGEVTHRYGFGDQSKWYAYASDKIRLIPSLTLTLGERYDHFSFSEKGNFSPRVSLSYELIPMLTRINLAYGEYYQTQSLPLYADNRNIGYNQHLENSHSRHFVAGIEHILDEGLKVSVEAYYKNYDKLPVDEEFIYYSTDNTFRSDKILNVGKRKSYGIEFFLQQKQVKDYYGTVSYTYSKTVERDPRLPQQVDQYPFTYDYPHIFTLIMGKVIKGTRAGLDEMPFYIKYPSMILPISDDMEVSFKFHYQTGRPYTPMVFMTDRQYRIGGGLWSRGGWINGDQINSARYPDYHRLDFQWISRYHLNGWNIEVFMVIQNLYNRGNVLDINYRSDGTTEYLYQFSFFPVGGIAIEF
jgi:hypothetical protein